MRSEGNTVGEGNTVCDGSTVGVGNRVVKRGGFLLVSPMNKK